MSFDSAHVRRIELADVQHLQPAQIGDGRSGPETIEDELIARKSERQFQGLAEGLPVICWTADATGSFDWYNHRWYEFTGQTPEEAVGWGWQAMHHPDDFLDVMRKWPHSIATGEPFEMEFRLRRRDGG